MQRPGRAYVDNAADEDGKPRLAVLGLYLVPAGTHSEEAQRHAGEPRRCQQRKPPWIECSAQVIFPREQSAVPGICGDNAQAQIAYQHQQRANGAEQAVPAVPFQVKRHISSSFPADEPRDAFKVSDSHVRVHILKPRFQAPDSLIRRSEELHPLIELTDKAVCSPALAGDVEAAAECSAGLEHAERLAVGRLRIRERRESR